MSEIRETHSLLYSRKLSARGLWFFSTFLKIENILKVSFKKKCSCYFFTTKSMLSSHTWVECWARQSRCCVDACIPGQRVRAPAYSACNPASCWCASTGAAHEAQELGSLLPIWEIQISRFLASSWSSSNYFKHLENLSALPYGGILASVF